MRSAKLKLGGSVEYCTVGDLHLDKLTNRLGENAISLQIKELRKVFSYAKDNGIRHVIYLGDICDNPRLTYEAIIAFQEVLKEFDEYFFQYLILGNHELECEGIHGLQTIKSLVDLGFFKNVRLFEKPEMISIEGVPFDMLPFPASSTTDKQIRSVNIAHIERPGALRDNGMRINKGGVEAEKGDKDIWVIGHLHTPQECGNSIYSGTLYQTNFGESLPKSFIHGSVEYNKKKNKLNHSFIRVPVDPSFKFFNLEVHKLSDLNQIQNNPLYLYKVFAQTSLELPKNLMTKYPNIVQTLGFTDMEDLRKLIDVSADTISHNVREGLDEFLEGRGLDSAKIKRAHILLDEAGL